MKNGRTSIVLLLLFLVGSQAFATDSYYLADYTPSAPAAGKVGSTAIHTTSNAIVAWANGYTNMQYGTNVDAVWQTPEKALGPAEGTPYEIVSLGRGGQITLTFPEGIGDRAGADFAVFENGVSDEFLELAWVEVSSDGAHFVRFPNYSTTPGSVGTFGGLWTRWIYGLASKYRLGYGTPFDLNELRIAYNAQLAGNTDFSSDFASSLTNGFPLLDLNNITHVRLVDIVGDKSAFDSRGSIIYDPYPTTGSAGFDLDAIGVLNESFVPQFSYSEWAADFTLSTNGLGDADGDGVSDYHEYRMGGNPNLDTSSPVPTLAPATNGSAFVILEYSLNRHALGGSWVETSTNLTAWTNAVPSQVDQEEITDLLLIKTQFSTDASHCYYRLVFEEE